MQSFNPILLVDDDPINAVAVEKAFHALGIAPPLFYARNGTEALEYLMEGGNAKPNVILLDVHMPIMNGIEFLQAVKADPRLRRIPVIMFTTSQDERDIADSFALGAAGYMIKPIDDEQLVETIKTIVRYWSISELPNQRITVGSRR